MRSRPNKQHSIQYCGQKQHLRGSRVEYSNDDGSFVKNMVEKGRVFFLFIWRNLAPFSPKDKKNQKSSQNELQVLYTHK